MNPSQRPDLIVFGAGGHAKVVIDLLERAGTGPIRAVFDDDPAAAGRVLLGRYPVAGGRDGALAWRGRAGLAVVAIGRNGPRAELAGWLGETGFVLAVAAVHPGAALGAGCQLGRGTVVMAGASINADTRIGENVIVNTGASVDHDCVIGHHVHIAPGAVLCGGVTVGELALVGAGAVIVPGIRIGARATIGAGSTVLADVADGATVAGTPARPVK